MLRFLQLPYAKNMKDLDDPKMTLIRKKIIQEKVFLKNLYTDFYNIFNNSISGLPKARRLVELGSGGGFIKEIIPDVITSDVLKLPHVDMRFSANAMPFSKASIDRFFIINVLHHIHSPQSFFKEIDRCFKKSGKLLMIDMANTLWSRFIYQRFHYEKFDPQGMWTLNSEKPLSEANGALAWIIFVRDRKKFERLFPKLRITRIVPHTPLRYVVSGGLTYKQFLPSWMYPVVKNVEELATPWNKYIGMFYTIEIEKRV